MLATILEEGNGYKATFERHWNFSVEEVWSWLTENDKLKQWFSELDIEDLREDGLIKFDMGDGTFEEMTIVELKPNSVFEFTWGDDVVRFELESTTDGCKLLLIEKLAQITPHTPKDLAGWHVCLDVVHELLAGKELPFRKEKWETWYEKYTNVTHHYVKKEPE